MAAIAARLTPEFQRLTFVPRADELGRIQESKEQRPDPDVNRVQTEHLRSMPNLNLSHSILIGI